MAKVGVCDPSFDGCVTCSSKHNRARAALCQCKHCSESFCFDCMKDHNDSLQESIAIVSNQYNEVQALLKTKKQLINDETNQAKKQISDWLQQFITKLNTEKAKIDTQIDSEELEVKKFIDSIETQVQAISHVVGSFSKASSFQSVHMQKVSENLEQLLKQLSSLTIAKEHDLSSITPQYKFKFTFSSASGNPETKNTRTTTSIDIPTTTVLQQQQDLFQKPAVQESRWPIIGRTHITTNNKNLPGENYFLDRDKSEVTSYSVDCIATDGINILYSSIEEQKEDIIAYCYLDPSRPWLLPTIIDMIWWNCIGKFVCATKNAVLTVEYKNERFKILTVLSNCEADMQIAVNSTELWVNFQGKIFVYNQHFTLIRSIKYYIESTVIRKSFCVTENTAALLIIRSDQTQHNILQIRFYDTKMKLIKSFDLGVTPSSCMVRSDGNDRFYITDGTDWLYIMSSKGRKQLIKLENEANCLAVINKRNIVLSKLRTDIELVHVPKLT